MYRQILSYVHWWMEKMTKIRSIDEECIDVILPCCPCVEAALSICRSITFIDQNRRSEYTVAIKIIQSPTKSFFFLEYFRHDRAWRLTVASNFVAISLEYIYDRTQTFISCRSGFTQREEKNFDFFHLSKLFNHFLQSCWAMWFRLSKHIEKQFQKETFLLYTLHYSSYVFGAENDPIRMLSWDQGYFSKESALSQTMASQSWFWLQRWKEHIKLPKYHPHPQSKSKRILYTSSHLSPTVIGKCVLAPLLGGEGALDR